MLRSKEYYEQEASYEEYLQWYKEQEWEEYPKPSLTVDCVVFAWDSSAGEVQTMFIKRKAHPYRNCYALPGGFVDETEDALTAVIREVKEETGVDLGKERIEQLKTFTTPNRDVRGWVVSVAHMVYLGNKEDIHWEAGDDALEVVWEPVRVTEEGKLDLGITLAFDHEEIYLEAITRVRNRLNYAPTILRVLGDNFVIRDARKVYAQFLGVPEESIDLSNFTKIQGKMFEEVGEVVRGVGRPKKLYRLK